MTLPLRRVVPAALAGLVAVALTGVVPLGAAADLPVWAYPVNPPDFKPRIDASAKALRPQFRQDRRAPRRPCPRTPQVGDRKLGMGS